MPTASTPGYTTLRGRVTCECMAEWVPAYEAELQRRGLLDGPLGIYQLTGDAAASGNTHREGGAGDFTDLPGGDGEVWVARQMGADATWARKYNWDGRGGMAHQHTVLRGCPHNGPARYQIDAVDDGFNGLGSGGRGAPDPGPRPLSGRTWREGIAWALEQGDDMPFTEKELRDIVSSEIAKTVPAIVRQEVDAVLDADLNLREPQGDPDFRGVSVRELFKRIGVATGAVKRTKR